LSTSSAPSFGVKIIWQPHVENEQRHGDAEDSTLSASRRAFENMAFLFASAAFVQKH